MTLPEISHKIIYPHGGTKLVAKRRRTVYPNKGQAHMRCGGCGSTDFTIHLVPKIVGEAQIVTLVCSICGKVFAVNDKGCTGGSLTIEKTRDARHREQINDRHDTS